MSGCTGGHGSCKAAAIVRPRYLYRHHAPADNFSFCTKKIFPHGLNFCFKNYLVREICFYKF